MSDELERIMRNDQADTEIEDTAGKVGKFYAKLREHDVPEAVAGEMTQTYGTMVVSQFFGVDVPNTFGVGAIYDVED